MRPPRPGTTSRANGGRDRRCAALPKRFHQRRDRRVGRGLPKLVLHEHDLVLRALARSTTRARLRGWRHLLVILRLCTRWGAPFCRIHSCPAALEQPFGLPTEARRGEIYRWYHVVEGCPDTRPSDRCEDALPVTRFSAVPCTNSTIGAPAAGSCVNKTPAYSAATMR